LFLYTEKKLLKIFAFVETIHPLLILSLTENCKPRTKNCLPPHPDPLPPRGEGSMRRR
jgi:hypothetical protein